MKVNKIIISILLLILFICIGNCVYATTISFSNENPQVGDSVKITVSVPNVHTATVYANVSGAGTSGQIKVVGGDMMGNKTTLSNSITVKPTSAGTITVSVTSNSSAVADGQYVNVAANRSITVTEPAPIVKPDPEPVAPSEPTTPSTPTAPTEPTQPTTPSKSSNAKLKNLGIRPNDFSGFRANTKRYEVTVPNDVSQVEVYATAQDAKATISGTGMKKLSEGSNNLSVVVTAEDGSKETYTIIVTRKVEEGEITPNTDENDEQEIPENEVTSGLSKLEVAGATLSSDFKTEEYKYTVKLEKNNINTLSEFKELLTAEANFDGASIEVTADQEKFEVGRNKIYITVKDSDGREIAIYTLVLKIEDEAETITGTIEDKKEDKKDKQTKKVDIDKIVVISAIGLMAVYSIIVSIIAFKQRQVLELNGLVEVKEEDDDDYNPFEEIKSKEEKIEENVEKNIQESEEEIRRRKIDEFLNGKSEDNDLTSRRGNNGKRFQ